MKRKTCLLSFLLIMTCFVSGYAQTITLKGGLNLSSRLSHYEGKRQKEGLEINPGFHLGGLIDIPIKERISIETGLILSMKGYKYHFMQPNFTELKSKVDLLYAHVPVNGRVTFNVGRAKIFGTVGPYIGYGIVGRNKYTNVSNTSISDESKIVWGDKGGMRRIDLGVGVGVGIEFNSIIFGVNYDLGLLNQLPIDNDLKVKNSVLGVSVGYRFAKK